MISKRRILAATLAATMLVCGIPNVTKAIEYNGATSGNSATSGNNASGGNTSSSGNTASDGNTSSSGNVQEKGKPEITFELDDLVIKDEQKGLNYISVDDLDNNSGIKVNVKDDKSNIVQTIIKVNNTEIINITYDEDNQEKSKAYNVKLEKAILKDDKYVINVTSINANNIDTIEEKVIYVESKAPEIINDSIRISGFTEEKDNYIIGNKLNVSFNTDSDNNDNQSSIETVEFYLANTNSADDIKNKSIILQYNNINNSNTTPVTTLNYEMEEKGYYTGYLCAYIKDICGKENYVLLSNKKMLLDNDNPTCTISINNNNYRLLDGKKWIKAQDIESYGYNYEIADNGSGIKGYSIKVNDNEVNDKIENIIEKTDEGFNKNINGSFELKDYTPIDGKYEIVIEAADNADNKSEESDDSKDIIYVDENAPYIDGKAEFKNITKEDDSYMYGNKNINISFNVKDDELSSGTDKVEIYEDDEFIDTDNGTTEDIDGLLNDSNRRGNAEITDGVATYTIIAPNPEEAAYEKYVYAKLYDKVGNYRYVALSDKKLIIEQNAPKISIEKEENSFYSNWFNKNVKYEITITDEESGIDVSDYNNKPEDYKIKVNNKPVNLENIGVRKEGNRIVEIKGTYTTDYKIGGVYNYIVSVKARDNAGNDNSNIPEEIGIDTKPPYVINDAEKKTTFKDKNDMEISPIGNEMFTNDDVKVNFYVKDEISGVNNIEIYALDSIIDVPKDSEIEQNKINPADVKISDDEVNVTIKRQDTTLNKYIYAKLTDNAGNSDYVLLSENKLVISSESKSIININGNVIYTDPEENKWIKESTEYAYSIEDKDSGIKSYEIKVNGTTVVDSTKSKDLNDKYDFKKNKVDDVEEKFTLDTETVKPDNGKYIITIYVCDNAGNKKENLYEVYYDKTVPENTKIEGKVAYTDPEGNKWIKEPTECIYSIEDSESGIKSYKIKVNGKTVVDSTKSKDLNEKYEFTNKKIKEVTEEKFILNPEAIEPDNGKYIITIDMCDNVGNEVENQKIYEVYYDKTVPENTKIEGEVAYTDPEGNKWIKESTEYAYSIEDKDSGIKSYEIKINGTTVVDSTKSKDLNEKYEFINKKIKEVTEEKFILNPEAIEPDNGKYIITIDMCDNAGNKKENQKIYEVYYDKTAPEDTKIEGKVAYTDPEGNKWIKESTEYTYSVEDKDSGIKSYEIKVNGTTVVDSTKSEDLNEKYEFTNKMIKKVTEEKFILNPETIEPNNGKYIITIDMCDNTGNKKENQEIYEVYYDKDTPHNTKMKCNSVEDPEGISWIKGSIDYTYSIEDKDSGIKSYEIKVNGTTVVDSKNLGNYDFINKKVKEVIEEKFTLNPNKITAKDGKYTIVIDMYDNTGNHKQETYTVHYDFNTPKLAKIDGKMAYITPSGNKWIKEPISYTYSIEDKDSGIKSYIIKINESTVVDSKDLNNKYNFKGKKVKEVTEEKFTLNPDKIAAKDGKYNIAIDMYDNAGNHKQETYTIYYDSNTPKATKFTMKSDKYVEGNSLPVTDDKYGYYFKHTTKVTVTLADDGTSSGISKVGYFLCKNGEKVSDAIKNKIIVTPTNNEITIQIPEAFKGQIYVAAVDNVGNGDLTKASSYVKPDAIVIDDNRNDKDIITINRSKTAYKDNSGLDLYNKDIPVAFNIKDVTSGIRSIEWEVTSANGEENNYSGKIDIDNSGKINGDNYNVISTDKNLITAISKAIAVRNNDNRITVNIKVEDRAGNISYATDTFSIDKTAPEISILYDNNTPDATNGKMFKSDRKAIISIKERNFNPKIVVIDIKNTDGTVPVISDWSVANGTGNGDNTTYTASLSYVNDGDYTFAMRYQDNADNIANINFVSGTVEPTEFTIDKTRPALSVQFNNNSAVNGNYYLDQRVVTFTIIEHNFDASRFELLINRNNAAVQQNINWTNNGDTHTASIALDEEALYSIMANYTDMAGNTIENAYNTAFYIDKKAPEVIISGVDNERAYRDNVVGFNISSADTYFESLSISLDLLNKDGSTTNLISNNEEKANVHMDYQNIENGRRLSVANLESDGIYRLVCKASDKAGRVTENNVLFSINRNGPTYYIDDEETLNIKDKYLINPQDIIFNEINVNELSADTIKITVYRGNTTWDLVEGKDYTIEKVEGIDTWCKYRYIISKDNFEENGIYHVTIASKDSVENDAISEKFSFVIDNEPPVCTIFELKNGNVYVADSKDIRFKVTDNIEAESVIVLLNGKEIMKLEGDDIKKNMSEDGTLKITIPSSNKSQNLIIKCIDKSGNESETEIKGFYITTNLWIRFINNKSLVIGISCAIVAIIVLIILMIIRKSNKNSTKITEKKTEKNK